MSKPPGRVRHTRFPSLAFAVVLPINCNTSFRIYHLSYQALQTLPCHSKAIGPRATPVSKFQLSPGNTKLDRLLTPWDTQEKSPPLYETGTLYLQAALSPCLFCVNLPLYCTHDVVRCTQQPIRCISALVPVGYSLSDRPGCVFPRKTAVRRITRRHLLGLIHSAGAFLAAYFSAAIICAYCSAAKVPRSAILFHRFYNGVDERFRTVF